MSIQNEIDRISGNISDAYSAAEEKGASMPEARNSNNLAATIRSISGGGAGVNSFNGRTGDVVPMNGDYTAAMVGARADTWAPAATDLPTVPINKGGTEATTAAAAIYNLINGAGTIAPASADLLPLLDASGNVGGRMTIETLAKYMRDLLGLNPVGEVMYFAGKTAPTGWLVCNGTVYNISDYPDLATFFQTHYGSKNYWGGNGTTTFAVPNWQGEFFRAAGTNSRSGQGSGAAVGVHQNGTCLPEIRQENNYTYMLSPSNINTGNNTSLYAMPDSSPSTQQFNGTVSMRQTITNYTNSFTFDTSEHPDWIVYRTARPTNTSLLVCIKY